MRRQNPSTGYLIHVSHLPGRFASPRWIDTSPDVPVNASVNRRGNNFAITITKCHRTMCIQRSHDETIVVDIGGHGNENGSTRGKLCRDSDTLKQMFVRIVQELRAQFSRTYVEAVRNPIGTRDGFFCVDYCSKFMSIHLPLQIFRRRFYVPQDSLLALVPFALTTCLKDLNIRHLVSCLIRSDRLHQ